MTKQQELHLLSIKRKFDIEVDNKYRKGVKEHGGNLWEMNELDLLDSAIEETIDQYTYLITLRGKMLIRMCDNGQKKLVV